MTINAKITLLSHSLKKSCEFPGLYTCKAVETLFTKLDERTTKMEFYHFYSTKTLKVKLLNLIAWTKIARESQATLNAIKKAIEDEYILNSTK
jgi:hypothetical protein